MKIRLLLIGTALFSIVNIGFAQKLSGKSEKPRTIVTTDGEIDDVDSFIRMLLYANEFQLEGLVYSSSMWHYKGDGKGTKMVSEMERTKNLYGAKTDLRWPGVTWMQELVAAYEKVYPNLSTHAKGFPTANYLRSLIKVGNIDFEGEMEKVTEGSEFIKEKLLDNTTEPIYLQVWGGTNTIARALKSIEEQYKNTPEWSKIYKKVCDKAIIYAILDQDATYKKYVAPNWPNLKVFYNASQFWCFAYPWKRAVPPSQHYLLEGKFMGDEIINNHGPLLKMYYSYGDGQKQAGDDEHIHGDLSKVKTGQWGAFGKYDFISEGDSPSYLHLIDVGLGNIQHPEYGGWGGRLQQTVQNPNRWEDGKEVADYNPFTQKMDLTYPQTRWIEAIQMDFAARADWCIKPYKQVNHAPKIWVKEGNSLKVKPGNKITLSAAATDPDGNKVNFTFWQYAEAGTSPEKVIITQEGTKAQVQLPAAAKSGDTIHIIVEGKDEGTPALIRYQRVILTME
jgi:hypothetical protein